MDFLFVNAIMRDDQNPRTLLAPEKKLSRSRSRLNQSKLWCVHTVQYQETNLSHVCVLTLAVYWYGNIICCFCPGILEQKDDIGSWGVCEK